MVRWMSRNWAGSTRRCWSWSRALRRRPMMRLRRAKLEVVVPADRARRYHVTIDAAPTTTMRSDRQQRRSQAGHRRRARFYLRVGLGRKATGSYYTPHEFVRFLVRETLGDTVSVLQSRTMTPTRPASLRSKSSTRRPAAGISWWKPADSSARRCTRPAASATPRPRRRKRQPRHAAARNDARRSAGDVLANVARPRGDTCPIRTARCWPICQAGRPRAATPACRRAALWPSAVVWSRCIACMVWTVIRWRWNWRSCRCGWNPMLKDCR